MPGYNKTFELSVEDLDLIEEALRRNKTELTLEKASDDTAPVARRIHDLLGRLHNQKTFYRPRSGAYVSG